MSAILAQDVAVVIVNFNAGNYLIDCLRALHNLVEPAGEIIVVDNASDDDSIFDAKRNFNSVQYICLDSNKGFASANNHGISATNKPWIALINPDAFVEEHWLQTMLGAITLNPEVAFLSSSLLNANDHQLWDGQGDCYHVSGLVWRRKHGQPIQTENSKLPLFSPCAAAALYQRRAIKAVGGFDEDYFCYLEDVDLGFRLRLAGYECTHVSEAICYHVGSGITQKDSAFSIYHGHRNLVWTYFKNMPTKLLWRYLPQHILMNIFSILYYFYKGHSVVILRSKWHAIKGLSSAIKKRSKTVNENSINQFMTKGWLTPYLNRND